jgi:hypothetical protein
VKAKTLLGLGVFGLVGCASFKHDTTVCSEDRALRCATAPECSFDRKRGCKVCQCSAPGADRQGRFVTVGSPDDPGK